jgi:hypothetical protein
MDSRAGLLARIAAAIALTAVLYIIPPVKTVYDSLYATALTMFPTMTTFDQIALRWLPLVVVAGIFYGVLLKLTGSRNIL